MQTHSVFLVHNLLLLDQAMLDIHISKCTMLDVLETRTIWQTVHILSIIILPIVRRVIIVMHGSTVYINW